MPGFDPAVTAQVTDLRRLLSDGEWHTLPSLSADLKIPEHLVRMRLGDLRREGPLGRRHLKSVDLWAYSLAAPPEKPALPEWACPKCGRALRHVVPTLDPRIASGKCLDHGTFPMVRRTIPS